MIENSNGLQEMLQNVIEKTTVIKNDLSKNGKTHYKYILEKLESALWDLNNIIELAHEEEQQNLIDEDNIDFEIEKSWEDE